MAASDVTTTTDAAAAAFLAGDYAEALKQALAAQAYLAGLPDSVSGVREMRWCAKKCQDLIANARKALAEDQTASGGIQRTKITHARPSASTL